MFPTHRGIYAPRSTMHQFAKPGYMNFTPFVENSIDPNQSFHSTTRSPEGVQSSSMPGSDFFDIDTSTPKESSSGPYTKKPQSKAERRAEHNAIERARRETLNSKFQMLAQILPNLNNYRRPSKNQIIEKAFEWVKQSLYKEERYRYQIMQLQNENRRLLAQLIPMRPIPPTHDIISPPMSSQHLLATPYTPSSLDNGWSTHHSSSSALLSPYANTLEISMQDFVTRSDEEDNISSANEDDIDYQSSTSKTSFIDQGVSTQQQQQQQQIQLQDRQQHRLDNGYQEVQVSFNSHGVNSPYWNQNHIPDAYNSLFTPPNNN